MNIVFYTNNSDPHTLDKNLTTIGTLTGSLREESDVLNPVVLCEGNIIDYTNCNYIEIPDFNRYYFIDSFETVRTNVFRINCHVDVLSTYASAIRSNEAIIARSEQLWDLYLDDGSFKVDNNPHILTKAFPSGFNNMSFVLAIADGGAGSSSTT